MSALAYAGLILFINQPHGRALQLQNDDLPESGVEFVVWGTEGARESLKHN